MDDSLILQRLESQGRQIEKITAAVQELQALTTKLCEYQNLEWVGEFKELFSKERWAEFQKMRDGFKKAPRGE